MRVGRLMIRTWLFDRLHDRICPARNEDVDTMRMIEIIVLPFVSRVVIGLQVASAARLL